MYDIIIIGAGPAGLTASIYALRSSKKVLVLESRNYGGQIINANSIENYPAIEKISGFDLATNMYNQAKKLGAEIVFEEVVSINDLNIQKEIITNKNIYKTKSVIIATGLENRKLGIPNEEELIGKGISYCATCDGNFYKDKIVAVVGGGNTALEDALYLSNIASKVYLIHRRDEFRGESLSVKHLKEKNNIEFIYESTIKNINGKDKLESIEIVNQSGNSKNIDIDGLFIAIGKKPENDIFSNLIELDSNGYIIANENCHTNIAGIFAAGDNRKKEVRQLVTATSDGAVAASEAIKYINNLESGDSNV